MIDEDLKQLIEVIVFSTAHINEQQKRDFFDNLLKRDPSAVNAVYDVACRHELGKWHKIEAYMESLFTAQPTRTPREVVNMVCTYKRIKRRMTPFLIKRARKIKDRVRKRSERGSHVDVAEEAIDE